MRLLFALALILIAWWALSHELTFVAGAFGIVAAWVILRG